MGKDGAALDRRGKAGERDAACRGRTSLEREQVEEPGGLACAERDPRFSKTTVVSTIVN
jgi:hypothetical protein